MEVANKRYAPGSEGLLSPLLPWLSDHEVSEILINQPGEVFIEKGGVMTRFDVPALNRTHLRHVFTFIANENKQNLDELCPLLSGNLFDGTRVQLVMPPASKYMALSIRRQSIKKMELADFSQTNFYTRAMAFDVNKPASAYASDADKNLLALFQQENWPEFIKQAIKAKKNIVISGETSSGKTTFLNACARSIDSDARILTLEDTYEIDIPHQNQLNLRAVKSGDGQTNALTMQDLVQAALRLRPDRILMGEVRGREILDLVSSASTGHEGILTTIHAPNPRVAFMRMIQMYKLNNVPSMRDEEIRAVLNEVIDVIIQVKKMPEGRQVHSVYFKGAFDVL
jgi:type IV secretion system protein VirB11